MPIETQLDQFLPIVNKEGTPLRKESRMRDVRRAHALYRQFYDADQGNRLNRMRMQLILDGFPPYDPAKQRAAGLAGEANINIGILKTFLSDASRPLVDQINGVEALVNVVAKQEGDEDLSAQCQVVQEEHFNTVTKDDVFDYHFRTQELVRQFVTNGVTVPYFPDEWDWRWDSEPLGNFLIKHNTKASESYVEAAFLERVIEPSVLSDKEKNGNEHWNKEEILRVLRAAAPKKTAEDTNYEDWEIARKENDFYLDTIIPQIEVVNCWIKELDGRISFFLFDKKAPKDFLYKKEFMFESNSQAFQIMTYGVGTTGTYHGIRGLAYDAVPLVLELNRLVSSFIDGMRVQSKLNLQPESEDMLQNLVLIEKAGFRIVPPGFKEVSWQTPNYAQTLIPGLSVLQGFLNQNVSSYAVEQGNAGGDARKTKAEVMAKLQQIAAASGGNAELFGKSWSRLVLEQFRRMIRKGYHEKEPGGKQIKEFRQRCKERGVEDDFWDKIDLARCTAVPAVGAGSASQQMMIMERLLEFMGAGFFDAEGQIRVQRDAVRLLTGSNEAVKSYMGTGEIGRPTQDHRNAVFENEIMSMGKEQPVWPNDNNQVHAEVHLGSPAAETPTGSIYDNLTLAETAMQQNDEDTLIQVTPVLQLQLTHTEEHVARMANAPLAARYRQQLQQISGTLVNLQRRAAAIQRARFQEQQRMMEEQQGQEMQVNREKDVSQQFWLAQELAQARMKLEENNQKTAQEMRHKEESHLQNMRIKDEEAAQKIAIKGAEAASKAVTNQI